MQTRITRLILSLCLIPLLVLIPTLTAFAQSDTQVRITQVDNSKFPTVTVYVSVTNAAGEPVGIDPNTIQISENGQVMQSMDVHGGGEGQAEPLTTMLVMDISGSMNKNDKFTAAKDAAKAYVNQMRPGDQSGLITFDTHVYNVQPITTDTAALIKTIDGLQTGSDTAMFDALSEAEKALEGVSGRKAIIVLTDGLDNQSHVTADDIANSIGPSGLTISTIGFGDASTASQAGLDETVLKSLAEKSGGLYSYAADSASLSSLYQQYGRNLQSEYAITYVSPSGLRDGVNRSLSVSISEIGAETVTLYNPGGVLPEVTGGSWFLFAGALLVLLLLLIIPAAISWIAGRFGGSGRKSKGRIKLANSQGPAPRKSNIKIK